MEKTRNLSIAEYFDVIQREYLIAQFRKKIYYSPKDKKYYQRVMDYKSDKIRDIAARNHLDSIFDNEEKQRQMRTELFAENGRPLFEMTETDAENYYSVENEFSYQGEAWTLMQVRDDATCVIYSPRTNQERVVPLKEICRII